MRGLFAGWLFIACFVFGSALIAEVCKGDGWLRRAGHNRMVRASGITPARVGAYEGVGMSTVSERRAIENACYWGQRVPLSIQTNYRNGAWHAVVRYK